VALDRAAARCLGIAAVEAGVRDGTDATQPACEEDIPARRALLAALGIEVPACGRADLAPGAH
jgi:hypothetical protein